METASWNINSLRKRQDRRFEVRKLIVRFLGRFELQFGQLSQRMKKARLLRPANQEPAIARLFWSSKYSKPVTKRNLIVTVRGVPGIATLIIKRSIRSISLSETPTRT
jgi:hypothetical protein